MKIGLVEVDGKIPNLAIMQIAAYHEGRGDHVEWFKGMLYASEYDLVYASKIFSFSPMPDLPANALIGGTGIDVDKNLPAEIGSMSPSYSFHPQCDYHLGFSMKGCRFRCSFCVVPRKEGRPRVNAEIDNLLTNPRGGDRLMLLDNDFFGIPGWKENLARIIELGLKVCFAQGLNIRILTDEQAEMLAQCKYRTTKFNKHRLTFAWDRFQDRQQVIDGINRCVKYGISAENIQFFVLIGYDSTPEQDLLRVTLLRHYGCHPFVMPFDKTNEYQRKFARWVNHKAIFRQIAWRDYRDGIKTHADSLEPSLFDND